MMGLARLAAMNGVTLLAFGAASSLVAAIAYGAVGGVVQRLPPARRARLLVAAAAAPAAIAVVLVGFALLPSLGAALGLTADHCPAHAGHVHLCLHHLPAHGPGLFGAFGLAALAAAAAWAIVDALGSAVSVARLVRLPARELRSGAGLVPSRRAFALTVGWLRPRLLVSTALVDRLAPEQLEIVLAHERAHAERRDALWQALARLVAIAHLPPVRRRILADLALACEQACDEAAAAACGDRLRVAETIVAAERAAAAAGPWAAPAPAFAGGEVVRRVERLLAPAGEAVPPRPGRFLLGAAVALAIAAPHAHHWAESILEHLPH